jgi:hypothetical protein
VSHNSATSNCDYSNDNVYRRHSFILDSNNALQVFPKLKLVALCNITRQECSYRLQKTLIHNLHQQQIAKIKSVLVVCAEHSGR